MNSPHPRPRTGKTRDDRLKSADRTRGNRKNRDRTGQLKEN